VVELRRFESRAEEYIHILQVLIGRGERPGADLPQVAANYESKVSARIEGERVAQDARQKLGLAMGLSYQEGSRLGPTADPLPLAPPQEGPAADLNGLVAQTLTRRGDYLASLETIEGARILLEAEKSGLFPTLDLELSAGYSGLAEGSGFDRWGNSLGQNIPGPSGAVRLTYKWPVDNNQVLGRLQQRFAQFRQSTIASENLSRTIGTAITAALDTAMKTAAETRRLRQSVALYEKALANEQKKVRMGLSTFLDIIVVEDLLGNAIQREISTRLRYAEALVRIRFEAGILVAGEGRQGVIRLEELGARPPAGPGRGAP
jgi:outer membrane protein TolC